MEEHKKRDANASLFDFKSIEPENYPALRFMEGERLLK